MTQNGSQILSISSGKGGVGKTFITVNVATCLAGHKKRVLVVDCDLGLANIDIMIGVSPQYTLKDVIFDNADIERVIIPTQYGFHFIPASSGVKEMTQLLYESIETTKTMITNLAKNYDYVILDTGAGISETVLQFNLFATKNIIVLNRELTSLTDAYATIKVIYQMFGRYAFHIIINSVKDGEEAKRIFTHIDGICKKFLGFPLSLLGHIASDEAVPRSILKRQVLMQAFPEARSAADLARIAENIGE